MTLALPTAPVAPAGHTRGGLHDLVKRAERGVAVHLLLWLLVAGGTGLWRERPWFCAVNAMVFAANGLLRVTLRSPVSRWIERDHRPGVWLYKGLVLANSVHWGVLLSASMLLPGLHTIERPVMIIGVAVACAGSISLAISRFLRLWYPLALLGPPCVVLLLRPGALYNLLALLVGVLAVYLYKASQVVHDDYWAAANARVELQERARQLETLSLTDALTQVHNRLHFEQRLAADWLRAGREGTPLSVLIVDLDHFKAINDTHGHLAGDRCLAAAALALRGALHRLDDVIARYGGEEFAVLLPGAASDDAAAVAERLRLAVHAVPIEHAGQRLRLSCSVGVSTLVPDPLGSPAALVALADKALYQAKQAGRNRVAVAA